LKCERSFGQHFAAGTGIDFDSGKISLGDILRVNDIRLPREFVFRLIIKADH